MAHALPFHARVCRSLTAAVAAKGCATARGCTFGLTEPLACSLLKSFAAEAEALRKRAELSDAMLLRKEPLTAEELEPLCIEKCATARTAPSAHRSCANQGQRPVGCAIDRRCYI